MVQDFFDIARVEAGELEVDVAPQDLRERARAVLELFEDTADDHKLTLELPDEPLPVRCDALRIDQVLNNLVRNAIKCSPDGGEVNVVVEQRSDKGCVSVKDQGIGIPRDLQREIFEPFRRVTIGKIPGPVSHLYGLYGEDAAMLDVSRSCDERTQMGHHRVRG